MRVTPYSAMLTKKPRKPSNTAALLNILWRRGLFERWTIELLKQMANNSKCSKLFVDIKNTHKSIVSFLWHNRREQRASLLCTTHPQLPPLLSDALTHPRTDPATNGTSTYFVSSCITTLCAHKWVVEIQWYNSDGMSDTRPHHYTQLPFLFEI